MRSKLKLQIKLKLLKWNYIKLFLSHTILKIISNQENLEENMIWKHLYIYTNIFSGKTKKNFIL